MEKEILAVLRSMSKSIEHVTQLLLQHKQEASNTKENAENVKPAGKGSVVMEKQQEFFTAVMEGDFKRVESLLSKNPDLIGSKTKQGFSAVHIAAKKGHFEIVDSLLSLSSSQDANIKGGPDGVTPLHICRDVDTAKFLLARGAHGQVVDAKGWSALHFFARRGDFDLCEFLVKEFPQIVKIRERRGLLAFDIANKFGHKHLSNLLQYGTGTPTMTTPRLATPRIDQNSTKIRMSPYAKKMLASY
jgi:Ankyrin repeats (3 copies)